MRYIILSVALGVMVTSNAWANNCIALPPAWYTAPDMVRAAVARGFDQMYADSKVEHTQDTDAIQACLHSKADFFVESIILHCGMGTPGAEQVAFNAVLNLCVRELGYGD